MKYYYISKISYNTVAFLYFLPLTLMKNIYKSCWSSDHFKKLTIFDQKYKIPCLARPLPSSRGFYQVLLPMPATRDHWQTQLQPATQSPSTR